MKRKATLFIFSIIILSIGLSARTQTAYAQTPPLTLDELKHHWWQADKLAPRLAAPPQAPLTAAQTQAAEEWWASVFASFQDGNWEVYFARPFNILPTATRLTFSAAPDTQPRLNAIATHIVFVSERDGNSEIYTMNTNGANQTRLTFDPALDIMPAWSPDSTQLLFVSTRTGNAELYRMNAGGQALTQLTNDPNDDLYPNWSPNGQQIAWVRRNPKTGMGALWVMNANGDNPHAITGNLRFLAHPIWSPDSTRLAFDYDADGDSFNQLGLINANGSGLMQLTCTSPIPYEEQWLSSWLPNGGGLLYSRLYFKRIGNKLVFDYAALWDAYFTENGCTDAFYGGAVGNYQLLGQDVQNSDQWPPVSFTKPLPTYSRAWQPLILRVIGQDIGPAGISGYERQFRPPYNSAWQPYDYLPTDGSLTGKIYFRSRATDNADHVEAWPAGPEGDTATTFFTWQVNGQLTDQRGVPLVNKKLDIQPAALEPIVSDAEGQFIARLRNDGKHTIDTTNLTMTSDRSRNCYLKPSANLLQNGGFEAGNPLAGWITNGSLAPQVNSTELYAGHNVIRLGQDCVNICAPPVKDDRIFTCTPGVNPGCRSDANINGGFRVYVLIADKNDNVHAFGAANPQGTFYQHRSPNGVWDVPIVFPGIPRGALTGVVDQQGNLYIVWSDGTFSTRDSNLYYQKRTTAGEWTAPSQIGKGAYPKVAMDGKNMLHIIFLDNSADRNSDYILYYRTMTAAGLWSEPVTLAKAHYNYAALNPYRYTLATTPQGVTHLLWAQPDDAEHDEPNMIIHKIHYPNNTWSTEKIIVETMNIYALQAVVDRKENLHLIWSQNLGLFYATLAPASEWSSPYALQMAGVSAATRFLIDSQDTVYVVSSSLAYRYKPFGQAWSDTQVIPKNGELPEIEAMTVGRPNSFHFIWTVGSVSFTAIYSSTASANLPALSAISQVVTLPSTTYRPTLAFMYQLQGGVTGQSAFDVTVTNGITATTVFSANQQTTWRLGWANLEAWQGQTITITFAVHQASGELFLHTDLDEISISAWQTPVVQRATPAQIDSAVATTIVITGENFMATPTVKLGESVLANVRWLNEHQLEVEAPSTLLPGIYDLEVSNPSGERFVRPHTIAIGRQFYLPLISR